MGSRIGDVFLWACGADPQHVHQRAERRWYHSLGASVFLTAILAGLSVVLVVRSAFPAVSGGVLAALAVFWALLVFNVDRIIVSRVLVNPSRASKAGLFAARFALAAVVSLAISEGVVLAILAPEVRQQVDLAMIQQQQEVVEAEEAAEDAARERYRPALEAIEAETTRLGDDVTSAEEWVAEADRALRCESEDLPGCTTGTGDPGPGAQTDAAEVQLAAAQAERLRAIAAETYYTRELIPVTYSVEQLETCGLSASTTQLTRAQDARCLVELDIAAAVETVPGAEPTTDGLLRRIVALSALGQGEHGATVWTVRIVFFLLLSLIDLIPLSSKLFGGATGHDISVRAAMPRKVPHFLDRDLSGLRMGGLGWGAAAAAAPLRQEFYQRAFRQQVDDSLAALPQTPPVTAPAVHEEVVGSGRAVVGQEAESVDRELDAEGAGDAYVTDPDAVTPIAPVARDLAYPPRPRPQPQLRPGLVLRPSSEPSLTFTLERPLTPGEHGVVSNYALWVVRDVSGERYLAKCCFPNSPGDPALRGLHGDIRLASLMHPNVVHTSDAVWIDEATGTHFITMEYYEHGDLARYIRSRKDVPLHEVLRIVEGVMSGLVEAHRSGILHLDIKPRNVLMDYSNPAEPVPVVTDFGISKLVTALHGVMTDGFRGTILYAPLEQIFPHSSWGSRTYASDLWSVAALLFELVSGEPPRQRAEVAAGFTEPDRHGDEYQRWLREERPEPPRLDAVVPEIPVDLADAAQRWLANDPRDRTDADPSDKDGVMREALGRLREIAAASDGLECRVNPAHPWR